MFFLNNQEDILPVLQWHLDSFLLKGSCHWFCVVVGFLWFVACFFFISCSVFFSSFSLFIPLVNQKIKPIESVLKELSACSVYIPKPFHFLC